MITLHVKTAAGFTDKWLFRDPAEAARMAFARIKLGMIHRVTLVDATPDDDYIYLSELLKLAQQPALQLALDIEKARIEKAKSNA